MISGREEEDEPDADDDGGGWNGPLPTPEREPTVSIGERLLGPLLPSVEGDVHHEEEHRVQAEGDQLEIDNLIY